MLTISAAFLLARLERALVHAAAVVAPDGDAWLLVGDARSGKSTTCATLAAAGWGYVSDDQVVLAAREDGVEVEGWLRPFHLDRNGEGGEPTGERREVTPAELGLAGWRRTAPLAGVILPSVAAREATVLTPVPAAAALAGGAQLGAGVVSPVVCADRVEQVAGVAQRCPRVRHVPVAA